MQKGFSLVLALLGITLLTVLLSAAFLAGIYKGTYDTRLAQLLENKENTGNTYSVFYPADFSILTKYGDDFTISQKLVPGQSDYSTAGIRAYSGDIPADTKLHDWLLAVSTDLNYSVENEFKKPCKESLDKLNQELAKIPYGGSDGALSSSDCLFYGVRDVRDTQMPILNTVIGSQAIEFTHSPRLRSSSPETHTLFTSNTGTVWDIYQSPFNSDTTAVNRAYKLLKESFKLN